jgi:DNA-binding transcriptional MerR regulator
LKRPKKKSRSPVTGAATPRVSVFSLELVVELTGLPAQSILHYVELGFVAPVTGKKGPARFDEEALRTLRRIEHLCVRYGMNLASVRLTLELLQERDRLASALRRLR